jgi:hypothetical protein
MTRASTAPKLEVHEHCVIGGPRAHKTWLNHITHSHVDGNRAHQHPDCGPASFTIDKDEWLKATGLRGGGRKKYTAGPTGEQLPIAELEDWQKTFEVVLVDGPPPEESTCGPGVGPIARMVQTFGMAYTVRDDRANPPPRRARGSK